jgi:hypothetical protein
MKNPTQEVKLTHRSGETISVVKIPKSPELPGVVIWNYKGLQGFVFTEEYDENKLPIYEIRLTATPETPFIEATKQTDRIIKRAAEIMDSITKSRGFSFDDLYTSLEPSNPQVGESSIVITGLKSEQLENKPISPSLYTSDYYAWTQEQAHILESGELQNLDVINLAEEIKSLGWREVKDLEEYLSILLSGLLRYQFTLDGKTHLCRVLIQGARREINMNLKENPTLKDKLPEILVEAYVSALNLFTISTNLDEKDLLLPRECPYTLEQILNKDFLPR